MTNPQNLFTQTFAHLNIWQVAYLLIVVVVTAVVARYGRRGMRTALERGKLDRHTSVVFGRLTYYAIWTFGLFLILDALHTNIVAVLGIIGLALSLAFQDVLRNLVAGLYLLVERPFRIGDYIAITGGATGYVEVVALRVTVLRTKIGERVYVPNATVFSSVITNQSSVTHKTIDLRLVVPEVDVELPSISQEIKGAALSVEGVLPTPDVTLEQIGDGQITLRLKSRLENADRAPSLLLKLRSAYPSASISFVGEMV